MNARPRLLATVFSDYICPFCYVGNARLDRLRARYDLKVNWCFIEIHPETPPQGRPVSELGYAPERWRRMMEALEAMAREEGLSLAAHEFTANSRRALLLAEAAKEAGSEPFYALHRRLFEAFLAEGRNIGDEQVLRRLAAEVGLAEERVTAAWSDPCYAGRLRQNLASARELGVAATPTFFLGERRLDGAVPFATLEAAAAAAAEPA